jgi:hypothetical protein
MIRPLRSSKRVFFGQRHADSYDHAAAELACGGLGIENATAIEGADKTLHGTSPVTSLTRSSQKIADLLCIENLSISRGALLSPVTLISLRAARPRIDTKLSCWDGSLIFRRPPSANSTSPVLRPARGVSLPASRSSSPANFTLAALIAAPSEAVCDEPPAMLAKGRLVSPILTVTLSSDVGAPDTIRTCDFAFGGRGLDLNYKSNLC